MSRVSIMSCARARSRKFIPPDHARFARARTPARPHRRMARAIGRGLSQLRFVDDDDRLVGKNPRMVASRGCTTATSVSQPAEGFAIGRKIEAAQARLAHVAGQFSPALRAISETPSAAAARIRSACGWSAGSPGRSGGSIRSRRRRIRYAPARPAREETHPECRRGPNTRPPSRPDRAAGSRCFRDATERSSSGISSCRRSVRVSCR